MIKFSHIIEKKIKELSTKQTSKTFSAGDITNTELVTNTYEVIQQIANIKSGVADRPISNTHNYNFDVYVPKIKHFSYIILQSEIKIKCLAVTICVSYRIYWLFNSR